jgi:hypothetical protein
MPDQSTLPTAEDAFGPAPRPPTAEEAFGPAEESERLRFRQINQGTYDPSPLTDFLFSENGPVNTAFHSAGRIARAFDFGANEAGPVTGLSDETKETLRRWSGYDKWSKGHQRLAKAASNVLLEPRLTQA